MESSKSRVVIVGGGIAGFSVAAELQNDKTIAVTIVDANNYSDWAVASPRAVVDPKEAATVPYVFPLKEAAAHVGAVFVQGTVQCIDGTTVHLVSGETLEADYVVVAIGGHYGTRNAPWKPTASMKTKEQRLAGYQDEAARIGAAKSVVIVGAGLVGVEAAGEIKSAFPDTAVTLVGRFLPQIQEKYSSKVRQHLEKLGVVLKSGRVTQSEAVDGHVTTSNDETIAVDLLYFATGFEFSGTDLFEGDKCVGPKGQLVCGPTLQLAGHDSIFGCGDIVQVPDGKFPELSGTQQGEAMASVVAKNIKGLVGKQQKLAHHKWAVKPVMTPALVSINRTTAVGAMGMPVGMGWMENFMARKFKAKDFFVSIKVGKFFGKGSTW